MEDAKSNKLLAYVDALQSQGLYSFLKQDAMHALKLTTNAFQLAAKRLINKGRVKKVYSEFYITIPPEYKHLGSLPPSWFIDDLMYYRQLDYYVGILSATALHGASHQQPTILQIVTNKQLRPITVGNVKIKFYYNKFASAIPTIKKKTETGTMNVSTIDATIIDLIHYLTSAGQIHNVATILIELQNEINIDNIVAIFQRKPTPLAIAQRLGYLLENQNLKLSLNNLESLIKKTRLNYRLLIPGSNSDIIERNKKWKIIVNEKLEPDV